LIHRRWRSADEILSTDFLFRIEGFSFAERKTFDMSDFNPLRCAPARIILKYATIHFAKRKPQTPSESIIVPIRLGKGWLDAERDDSGR
jgi:hypothetical protein